MWAHSESTARAVNKQITRKFVLFKNLIARLGSKSAFVNFGVHGSIVLYRISWYTESYYKGFVLYWPFYIGLDILMTFSCTLLSPMFADECSRLAEKHFPAPDRRLASCSASAVCLTVLHPRQRLRWAPNANKMLVSCDSSLIVFVKRKNK